MGGRGLPEMCRALGIPCAVVDDVNGTETLRRLQGVTPDLILTFHFDQILTEATIAVARLGGMNVHPSLLPRFRGPVPTLHALLEDEVAWGVTVHRLVAKIDAGEILAQLPVDLPEGTTGLRAARLLHEAAVPMVAEQLRAIEADDGVGAAVGKQVLGGQVLPYCGFLSRGQVAAIRAKGRRLWDWRDVRDALRLCCVDYGRSARRTTP